MNAETITYLTTRPLYPWSEGWIGLAALGGVALLLVLLTLWTYLNDPQASRRRLFILIGLRLLALLIAILTLLRPSLAIEKDPRLPSRLAIVLDASESMTIQDEFNNQTRWDVLTNVLERCQPIFEELKAEQNVTVDLYTFGEGVESYSPGVAPDDRRTDFGTMLATLYDRYQTETDLKRGLIIVSDGANNGIQRPAEGEAARWQNLCRVYTFALGKTTTSGDLRDIAVTSLTPDPSPVPIKGNLTVKAMVNAPGFVGAKVRVHLLFDDEEVKTDTATLLKSEGNIVEISADAPTEPGEIKVTLKIDPINGEVTPLNNTIESYVTVTKEGLSVLVIDRLRLELKYIREVLSSDKRIRYYEAIRQSDDPPPGGISELFQFDQQHYDVIIIGDVSATRLTAGNSDVMRTIERLVKEEGVGLMMIGGIDSFGGTPNLPGSGGWRGTPIGNLLPVDLSAQGQRDESIAMMPTQKGLDHYLLGLDDDPQVNADIWRRLNDPNNRTRLNGMNQLGSHRTGATVLARVNDPVNGLPLMVGWSVGRARSDAGAEEGDDKVGRVLAFGADSTWMWRRLGIPLQLQRNPVVTRDGIEYHQRFWKQAILWLAHQEKVEGNVWVQPEFRRLPVKGKQILRMGLRGQAGNELEPTEITYQIVPPGEEAIPGNERNPDLDAENKPRVIFEPNEAGEYHVVVRASGIDTDGSTVSGEATARFIVYPDVSDEMMKKAANHDFLRDLESAANPGQATSRVMRAEDLPQFLRDLKSEPLETIRPRPEFMPDWRRDAMPWFLPTLLVLFVCVLGFEWGLRRIWGMV